MKVLYVNHTARMSGGELSLVEVLTALPASVEPILACPEGELANTARGLGIPVTLAPGTEGSLKLHPLRTPRAAAELLRLSWQVSREASRRKVHLIHANSIRAGLATSLSVHDRAVVHVRDCLPAVPTAALTRTLIARRSRALISNSAHTESRFLPGGAGKLITRVIHEYVNIDRFDPKRVSRHEARSRLGLPPEAAVLAVVGQITPWKGQEEAIRVLARLRHHRPDARLLIVGAPKFVSKSTRYDNVGFLRSLEQLAIALDLTEAVSFLGDRQDIPEILAAVDILLVPSWEEPFGRTVIEGMAMGLPVIATTPGGPSEIITDGHDGLLLAPKEPEAWAVAVRALLDDERRRATMGRAARKRAAEFTLAAHVAGLVELYAQALDESGPR